MKKAKKETKETMEQKIMTIIVMLISSCFKELKESLKGKVSKKNKPLEFVMLNSLMVSVVKTVLTSPLEESIKSSIIHLVESNSNIVRYTKAIKSKEGITQSIESIFLPNIITFFDKCKLFYKVSGKYIFVSDKQFTDIKSNSIDTDVNKELVNSIMNLLNS